jgi:hypothetical protein
MHSSGSPKPSAPKRARARHASAPVDGRKRGPRSINSARRSNACTRSRRPAAPLAPRCSSPSDAVADDTAFAPLIDRTGANCWRTARHARGYRRKQRLQRAPSLGSSDPSSSSVARRWTASSASSSRIRLGAAPGSAGSAVVIPAPRPRVDAVLASPAVDRSLIRRSAAISAIRRLGST